ncbi:MAG TPA: DUF202 domain-containing protein [Nitrospirae bacterium]|nr:DUF202 domain-containing protein [Nitrospirota bacterium]HDH49772.1 DUF202 domain-containing protein [Nitrospirota bacterium]HDK81262.1 DUF202 domain-containing protein [Nitrospirota bacterium]
MENSPVSRNAHKNPDLRDHLAAQRTILANERTFLAYIRTALTLLAAGVVFVKFFGHIAYEITGWLLIPLGILTFIKGIASYIKMKRLIAEEERDSADQQ